MKLQEILDGNKLIAEFMSFEIDNSFPDKNRTYNKNGIIELDTTFKYHKDWNLLMPVVEKIEETNLTLIFGNFFEISMEKDKMSNPTLFQIFYLKSKITAVFRGVVEFIKWYNDNKSTNIK